MLPVFGKAKLAIELLLSNHLNAKEYAEAILVELEDLEIEALYKECEIEGTLTPSDPYEGCIYFETEERDD